MYKLSIASNAAHFTQEHILFGQSYILEFEWIEREEFWVLHFYDGSENPIALGLRLSLDWPIFVDQKLGLFLGLIAKVPNAVLSLSSLHKDFALIAENVDATV